MSRDNITRGELEEKIQEYHDDNVENFNFFRAMVKKETEENLVIDNLQDFKSLYTLYKNLLKTMDLIGLYEEIFESKVYDEVKKQYEVTLSNTEECLSIVCGVYFDNLKGKFIYSIGEND